MKLPLLFASTSLLAVQRTTASSYSSSTADCTVDFCKMQLSPELTKRYKITVPDNYNVKTDSECKECKLTVQLSLDGYAWIGMGVSRSGGMIGSHVVM